MVAPSREHYYSDKNPWQMLPGPSNRGFPHLTHYKTNQPKHQDNIWETWAPTLHPHSQMPDFPGITLCRERKAASHQPPQRNKQADMLQV